jgi:hypothetical protein
MAFEYQWPAPGTSQVLIDHGLHPAAGTHGGIRVPAAHQSGANDHH